MEFNKSVTVAICTLFLLAQLLIVEVAVSIL